MVTNNIRIIQFTNIDTGQLCVIGDNWTIICCITYNYTSRNILYLGAIYYNSKVHIIIIYNNIIYNICIAPYNTIL